MIYSFIAEKLIVDGYDCTYCKNPNFTKTNTDSLGRLLIGYFKYYAFDFDFATQVASIRTTTLMTKDEKGWTDVNEQRNYICVEDPFETDFNVGRTLAEECVDILKFEFIRAYDMLVVNKSTLEEVCKVFKNM
jgi:DNA polymerase sigma